MELNQVVVRLLRVAFAWGRGDHQALYSLPQEYREILCQAGLPMKDHTGALVPPDPDRVCE